MKKLMLGLVILASSAAAMADEHLCTYHTRISDRDKVNSSGKDLTRDGYTKSSVANIIRQDRANYYVFKKRDADDEEDCLFQIRKNRELLEKFIKRADLPRATIREIVDNNPLIEVKVYEEHLNIRVMADPDDDIGEPAFIQ